MSEMDLLFLRTIAEHDGASPAAIRDATGQKMGAYTHNGVIFRLRKLGYVEPHDPQNPGCWLTHQGRARLMEGATDIDPIERIRDALEMAVRYGGIDGDHHKAWVIDQMVRALTGCPKISRTKNDASGTPYTYEDVGESPEYLALVSDACGGDDGPNTYTWETGTAP